MSDRMYVLRVQSHRVKDGGGRVSARSGAARRRWNRTTRPPGAGHLAPREAEGRWRYVCTYHHRPVPVPRRSASLRSSLRSTGGADGAARVAPEEGTPRRPDRRDASVTGPDGDVLPSAFALAEENPGHLAQHRSPVARPGALHTSPPGRSPAPSHRTTSTPRTARSARVRSAPPDHRGAGRAPAWTAGTIHHTVATVVARNRTGTRRPGGSPQWRVPAGPSPSANRPGGS